MGRDGFSKLPKTGQEGEFIVAMKPKIDGFFAKALKLTFSNSIFLALNGALVFVFASFLYGIAISPLLALASFLITFSVYSLNMVTDCKEDAINRSQDTPKRAQYYLALSIVSLVISIAIGIADGPMTLLILLAPLIIGFAYSVKIAKPIPRLKEIVGVKSLIVALSWAITGAFLPATIQPIEFYKEILVFLYIFAQILVNTIVFDALDVRGDHASGILTVPLALGKEKTKKLLLCINGLLAVWFSYCLATGVFLEYLPTLGFGVIYETVIIWYFFKTNRPRLHAEVFVDGEWLPLVLLMRLLLLR